MGIVRNPGSNGILSSCATMKLQLAALLLIGLALDFSVLTDANVMPGVQFADVSLHSRTLIPRDGFTEFPSYAKNFGKSARSRSKWKAVEVPDFPYNEDYLTRFSLGTPPREFTGYLDTGSDVVWVQCDPCKECVPQVALFETNTSTSYETLTCSSEPCTYINATGGGITNCTSAGKCEYYLQYGTGEATGELSSDVLTLSGMGQNDTFSNFVFGCTNEDGEGAFPIVALSRSKASLVGQLGPKVGTAFSFCFLSYYDNKTTEFTLGSRGAKDLMYTPFVPSDQTLYYVNMTGISVDGILLPIPAGIFSLQSDGTGGIILDTGSSITSLSIEAYYPLRGVLGSVITYPTGDGTSLLGLDSCYNVTELAVTSLDQLTLPNITFHFQDLDLQLPPSNTFAYNVDSDNVLICLAMAPSAGPGGTFGNYQMQNHYYFFDPDNGQVGLKPQQC